MISRYTLTYQIDELDVIQLYHCFSGNIPECLSWGPQESLRCFISQRRREILHLGYSQEPRDKRSGIFPDNCYVTFSLVKTLEKLIRDSRCNVTPADSRDVMSKVAGTVNCPSLVQSGVLFDPEIFTRQYSLFGAFMYMWSENSSKYLMRFSIERNL